MKKNLCVAWCTAGVFGVALAATVWPRVPLPLKQRVELVRLRAETKMWADCNHVRPGMSRQDVIRILGEPANVITGAQNSVHLLYHVKPHFLPDKNVHIDGCTVILTNGVVATASLAMAVRGG